MTISVAVFMVLVGQAAWAQTTGNIRGQAVAAEGEVLPGVNVTIESEDLMGGQRSAITGGNGTYSFPALPPGVYSVTASLDGHQTQRTENVRVNINTTTSIDFTLPEVFSEEVMVTADAPVVDLTSSSVGVNYDSEFTENLPTTRNFWDLMAVSPGISQSSEQSAEQIAFGTGITGNSWQVDGVETSLAGGGYVWWWHNPDIIEEVQVLGIGASAEFGNMLGAAFNVVTKSGGNEFHGALNAYFQHDSLTDTNVELEDSEYPSFVRDKWQDITATLGGPIKRDRLWFFAAIEHRETSSTPPGVNPEFAAVNTNERYDLKLNWRINDNNMIDAKAHWEEWVDPWDGDPFYEPSALGSLDGDMPSWGLSWQSILSDRTFLEVKYAGWDSRNWELSQTGSTEDPYVDWDPPEGGPSRYSGGKTWPWFWDTGRNQIDASVSHFADDFIAGDHDFKFGVQYGNGYEETKIAPGPRGLYYYSYDYYDPYYYDEYNQFMYTRDALYYGNEQDSLAAYVNDSWTISPKLTLNLGVRWDGHKGWIPAYPRLDMNWQPTGETAPRLDAVDWSHVSPRLGFAWNPTPKTIIRGSYGVFYAGNIGGDWNYPPPDGPTGTTYQYNPNTGEYDTWWWDWEFAEVSVSPDLKPPQATQYSLGFETQLGKSMAIGAQVLYKETKDLIGWEILDDGVYEDFPFTDPFTGTDYILWNQIEQATAWKGNSPGVTANPDADEYWQEYTGLLLTFRKRLSNNWSMMASYTWSESKGLTPQARDQSQLWTLWGTNQGRDPNEHINAEQLLQGDRPHMFTLQANVLLPWNMHASAMLNIQSGRPYSRQIGVGGMNQGWTTIIMRPADDDNRLPSSAVIDLAWGKRFSLGQKVGLLLDLQLLNALNEDAWDWWETLVLQEGETFIPATSSYFTPRRLQVRVGIEF
jgi:outer membrane receptor protein involved in Fe transport